MPLTDCPSACNLLSQDRRAESPNEWMAPTDIIAFVSHPSRNVFREVLPPSYHIRVRETHSCPGSRSSTGNFDQILHADRQSCCRRCGCWLLGLTPDHRSSHHGVFSGEIISNFYTTNMWAFIAVLYSCWFSLVTLVLICNVTVGGMNSLSRFDVS